MEEKELVRKSQKGNEEAFSVLVRRYKTKVFHLAYSLTGDRDSADDLAQEAFIKAYFGLPGFQFRSGFGTWLYRITVNHVKDYLRKKGKMSRISIEKISEASFAEEDDGIKKEKEQAEEKRRQLLRLAVQALPEKHRIILSLRDIQGLSYAEIAEILNIPPGTVDSRLHRARKMLRKKIAPFLRQKGGGHEMSEGRKADSPLS